MARKFLTASEIKKIKGYDENVKLDGNMFMKTVSDYFMSGKIGARLKLMDIRFVDYPGLTRRSTDFFPVLDEKQKCEAYYYSNDYAFSSHIANCHAAPTIFIDVTYAKSAVALLKMSGYSVEKASNGGYIVSLI